MPSLLPVLVPHQHDSDSYFDDEESEEEEEENEKNNESSYQRRISNPSYLRKRKRKINSVGSYVKPFFGMKKRSGLTSRFRNRRIKRNYY